MSELKNKIINKIEEKKYEKEKKLLNAAYKLFTEKGINNTSIQDIVDEAGVAKGTFYLYFKDKYSLQETLVTKTSANLFKDAINSLNNNYIEDFEDQVIYIINYVIDRLVEDPTLINFISKDLSLGFYSDKLTKLLNSNEIGVYDSFINTIKEKNISIKNPEITLFMIVELVSSTCFTTITQNKPLPINEYKPFLYETIRKLIRN